MQKANELAAKIAASKIVHDEGEIARHLLAWMNKNPFRPIEQFNIAAGNTTEGYNPRQIALYVGMQLEEMAEKLTTLFDGNSDVVEGAWLFVEAMTQYGDMFKRGDFDHMVALANREELLDDDIDQIVVTVGSILSQGANLLGALDEVSRANMDKVWPDGTLHKDENGKVIKPEGWTGPNLAPYVTRV